MANLLSNLFKKSRGPLFVNLQPSGERFSVQPKDTLLQAALSAGVPFPHDCRVGTCATCKCLLVEGKVKAIMDFSYTLSREEMEQGYILACQAMVKSDLTVALDRPLEGPQHTVKSICGVIRKSEQLTHDILKITIELDESIIYEAGQYADLSVPSLSEPRSYSFADAPNEQGQTTISFFIRHVVNGEMTGWLHAADRTGVKVSITGPYGSFYLRPSDQSIVCIAGGSGLAPLKAILEKIFKMGGNIPVLFLFGARTQRDLYCLDVINEFSSSWNAPFHFVPVLSEEPADSDWSGARGLVTEHIKDLPEIRVANSKAYLCGPPGMIDAAISKLNEGGVTGEHIFFDKFLDRYHVEKKMHHSD
ncbi:2Fe-2S iron-sulfur cluster binding domain-containing protein [Paenibacillus validus]|uniref:2Fe-2S iron-sulfur cluster-binding protein n=1 Tax=Paenibacillus TaxID=44249 RepID=UPI000FD7806D|nr:MULTISPECIES: 2Fe-2S iron-sulfur cluster binding domain-containing protein [Paenibacillus]MED4600942.1 2Fe-2S iron-sulfur cluster binding domain-containing protein [Paenibacillus validus]MED4606941.1 2Fe-2S iron-sulfur cluster binding domain-containing protein [Paenibacillus validus]